MAFNETITYGNVTTPFVSEFLKVDQATGGGLTLLIHAFVFIAIVVAFFKKDRELERGIAVAGFTTSISSTFLVVVGYLSWDYIWMSISLFVIASISLAFDKR